MSDAPPPDFHVDAELAARLVSSQHPDLAGPLTPVANGWDNAIFRLGDELAVRLPRRELAVRLVEHEQRWLPRLAPRLPVAVPAPVRIGRPAPQLGYDVPWSIVPWLPGRVATEFATPQRDVAAHALAEFVAALARPAPPDAPRNAYRGVPLAQRDDTMRARFAGGRLTDASRLVPLWERALAAPEWSGPRLWVHGDLHPANLLLGTSGHLAAVIDFGDLTAGDPATDLATAWLTFGPEGRRVFREEVEARTSVDDATWGRARGWALVIASAVVEATGTTSPLGQVAAYVLEQLIAD
ncbi:aminoglycoside phosphotransferase family protein [Agromyces sp. SYSU K20354]|uniref:aminoglycoside phosphotransferase family protein n=1 Tax=Agromyces cavernae TaxID=2898659 RepID=UPI001E491746|nr:aminoglycoside phosphotransferase family protein [Agromyces cavernae]MCD2440904.1 aminoglycoside phosphotransferase family protein [Agromyces cavernae]